MVCPVHRCSPVRLRGHHRLDPMSGHLEHQAILGLTGLDARAVLAPLEQAGDVLHHQLAFGERDDLRPGTHAQGHADGLSASALANDLGMTMIVGIVTEVAIFYYSEYRDLPATRDRLILAGINRIIRRTPPAGFPEISP